MSSDRSRRRQEQRDGYKEAVAQQGRVILDRDINAVQRLTADRIEHNALDFVGPCGTPDNGFAISIPGVSPPASMLWSPPAFFDQNAGNRFDFAIAPGTMYVGGERAYLPQRQAGQEVHYSYFDQPDWLIPSMSGVAETKRGTILGSELVYLELTEQEVSAVEDPELLDVALGGPDTTQRVKLLQRIKRLPVAAAGCSDAWSEAAKLWLERDGRRFDPKTMRLEPLTRLQVGFTQELTERNPCDPVASGGYFGVDNQLIRIQLRQGDSPSLLWSYDNASFLYRVTSVSDDRTMLTLAKDPPDSFHIPQTGQLIEVLRTAAVLGKEPDETDPTGETVAYRVVAETQGELRRLTQPYGPVATGDDTRYIVLDSALPQDYAPGDGPPIFLRVWRAELPVPAGGGVVALDDPATGTSTGVEVTLSVAADAPISGGAFWEVALRPATPQGAYPEQLLVAPQHPEGPRQWVCPLAVIDWTGEAGPHVSDCRQHFDSLVELTRRRQGCCTVSISPADLVGRHSLQSFADRAAAAGRGSKLCLAPGTYRIDAPLRLTSDHSTLTIEACGPAVILRGANDARPTAFSHGMILVEEAASVTLRGLRLLPVPAPIPFQRNFAGHVSTSSLTEVKLMGIMARLRAAIGIRAINSPNLAIEDCQVKLSVDRRVADDVGTLGAGLFLQGLCPDLIVRNCNFDSEIDLTFHPRSQRPAQTGETTGPLVRPELVRVEAATPSPEHRDFGDVIERARLSLSGLNERIGAAESTTALSHLVLTTGIAAVSFVDNLPDDLGDPVVEGCRFSNLTLAAFGRAHFGNLRLEHNRVDRCVSGFWLNLPDSTPPSEDKAKQMYLEAMNRVAFEELDMTAFLASYALPPEVKAPAERVVVRPRPSSIFFLANQVEALPQKIEGGQGSAALVIIANVPPQEETDRSVSLVLSSNNLRNRSTALGAPSAVLIVPNDERSALTGNLIMNEGIRGVSLAIIPDTTPFLHLLAVTGNVLRGSSNLPSLFRDGAQQQTWVPYNAMPS
ncbi:hypothetical protein XI09_05260 [Bradyrhizobium sp. CCBAU 11386]|uniref:DUF6519 domain-containing protein n=1 Tax=Bradyrhizobium sp. CCBAU 11386 TaxID=1630837 RepID=UPI0023029358|nr:DUF6519 domain-containing protein [Bradyrhizobium sp. CCBAU 11386]MDA9504180.1 hypothetical protein [Bradyrhizobium sp. CCBAU 11386]